MKRFNSALLATALVFSPGLLAEPLATAGASNNPLAGSTARQDQAIKHWRFRVSLGKREIGYHDFRVIEQDGQSTVEINAEFRVKILFLKAYSYDHRNTEVWNANCMQQIRSETDDNGDQLVVNGSKTPTGFTVSTQNSSPLSIDAACIQSFAYWNPAILEADHLLNSQTGELTRVNISEVGEDLLNIEGVPVEARRYRIEMDQGDISLWYASSNGQWLALEAPAPGKRVIRYDAVSLPFSLEAPGPSLVSR